MGRRPTFIRRGELIDLTMRTDQGRALLRPTRALTGCVLRVLAHCLDQYRVWLHAFIVMSNHAHLLLTVGNALHATSFVRDLKRDTSKRIKRMTGWDGRVWATGRMTPVLDDAGSLDRMRYILANGVKEGLVEHPLQWPGANSTRALLGDMRVVVPPRQLRDPERTISLAPLPCLAHHTAAERRATVASMIDEVVAAATRDRNGRPAAGLRRILDIDPFAPIPLERRGCPVAHAREHELVVEYCSQRDAHADAYRAASTEARELGPVVAFPQDSFLPPAGFQD